MNIISPILFCIAGIALIVAGILWISLFTFIRGDIDQTSSLTPYVFDPTEIADLIRNTKDQKQKRHYRKYVFGLIASLIIGFGTFILAIYYDLSC